jgi:hypothetical protein
VPTAAACGLEFTTGQDHSRRAMLLDGWDLIAALNEGVRARARKTITWPAAISGKKDPVVTIGHFATSLATSGAVLSNQ